MKHTIKITLLLVAIFFAAQFIGLAITRGYIDVPKTIETGELSWQPLLKVGETEIISRPETQPKSTFMYILAAVLIGTALVFLLIRFRKVMLWRFWFFLAVAVCLSVAFNAFMATIPAIMLGILLAGLKIFRPSIIIHNVTELFVYGGLAAIFVPVLNIFWVIILLIAISIYDAIAVWKSKHMIKLAKAQSKAKFFAGLLVPYSLPKKVPKAKIKGIRKEKIRTAILGGGDIGFPLLFAGVVMKNIGFWKTLVIPAVVTIALLILLLKGKKEKFYPAMPFLSIGCIIGYLITLLF